MKNVYLIRHAPTIANLMGQMVPGYDDVPILDFTEDSARVWHSKVGRYLPSGEFRLYSSPTVRCMRTAEMLFPDMHIIKMPEAREFDCSFLGNRKFWEISRIEFESLIHFSCYDMARQVKDFIDVCELTRNENIVVISSGMFIRYLYYYMRGNETIAPFDVLNSVGFSFHPLDMLHVNLDTNEVDVYRNP